MKDYDVNIGCAELDESKLREFELKLAEFLNDNAEDWWSIKLNPLEIEEEI